MINSYLLRIQAVALATLAAGAAAAEPVFESFEEGFGLWTGRGYIHCQPDCPFNYSVTRTQEQAHDGQWSLDVTADGYLDDGTVWIQRAVELSPGTWNVRFEFQFFSAASDVNNWQVVGYVGLDPPEVEQDFSFLGDAGIGGWSPYAHAAEFVVDAPSTVYLALGYNITWETERTHWFDSVTISGLPPQPTPGDLDGDGAVGVEDFLLLLAGWGPCPDPCLPACAEDINGDCAVGIEDFLILLAHWGPSP